MSNHKERNGPDGAVWSIRYSTIIDLSWPLSPTIPQWPGDPPFETEVAATIEESGYYLRRFSMGEHSGTHCTAPASFFAGGAGPVDYQPEQLVAPAIVLDVSAQCNGNSDFRLRPDQLEDWEARHGRVPEGSVALLHTAWDGRWHRPGDYLGADAAGRLHFPGFGLEAAQVLLEERGVAGLGTDTAGLEPGIDHDFPVSKLVLSRPRIALENLTNLGRLPATGATLVIGLIRLTGGSGAPAAVTAFVP